MFFQAIATFCVIWLLVSVVSMICLFASAIADMLCVPLVVGVQLKVIVVLAPAARLFTAIFPICMLLSYSLTTKLFVMSVVPLLVTVTVTGYVVPVMGLFGSSRLEIVRSVCVSAVVISCGFC